MCRFFFSSRRRHTRCGRDWSSDVCSSDLLREMVAALINGGGAGVQQIVLGIRLPRVLAALMAGRSEERRVGKSVGDGGGPAMNARRREADNSGMVEP